MSVPLILNPGGVGGALHARAAFASHGSAQPPTAELSTLTYVARIAPDGVTATTSRARTARVGWLPGHEAAADWAVRLFPGVSPARDVVVSSLSNVNLVLHPPAAVLGAAWVEATAGEFRFYVDAMTPGVGRVLEALDVERLSVAKAYGHVLPSLVQEMAAIGTVDQSVAEADAVSAIRGGTANASIKAPSSLEHRYYRDDLAFGLKPFVAFADLADIAVPVASSLLTLGFAAAGLTPEFGLDSRSLGIERMALDQFLALIRQ
jgi:opine dehydrogenase